MKFLHLAILTCLSVCSFFSNEAWSQKSPDPAPAGPGTIASKEIIRPIKYFYDGLKMAFHRSPEANAAKEDFEKFSHQLFHAMKRIPGVEKFDQGLLKKGPSYFLKTEFLKRKGNFENYTISNEENCTISGELSNNNPHITKSYQYIQLDNEGDLILSQFNRFQNLTACIQRKDNCTTLPKWRRWFNRRPANEFHEWIKYKFTDDSRLITHSHGPFGEDSLATSGCTQTKSCAFTATGQNLQEINLTETKITRKPEQPDLITEHSIVLTALPGGTSSVGIETERNGSEKKQTYYQYGKYVKPSMFSKLAHWLRGNPNLNPTTKPEANQNWLSLTEEQYKTLIKSNAAAPNRSLLLSPIDCQNHHP